jgi:hypothetical protein
MKRMSEIKSEKGFSSGKSEETKDAKTVPPAFRSTVSSALSSGK